MTAVAAVLLLTGCGAHRTQKYTDFLYESMPLPDRMVQTGEWWRANVEKTLQVRQRMGWDIPEREFRHFVLPLRVNNEALDDFRLVYADSLCERVEGLGMAEAALEINHWCHERATYRASDGRTSSPMATIRSGLGRCGEESVLTVAAMRAAGIPSRQVYTPRWAHTDDNHAWVEVYVDGGWHFLGACEPEAALDMGWFNGPVSRAMLLHTKAFGDYRSDEDVISRTSAYTEVNVIGGYVPVRRTAVTVLDPSGAPVEGASVEFKIYNYAEYYTVAKYVTGADGRVALNTGFGDVMVWAAKGESFGLAKGSSEEVTVVLDHRVGEGLAPAGRNAAGLGSGLSLDFDIVPPAENPLPARATTEQTAANSARLAEENAFRENLPHGNAAVTESFVAAHGEGAKAILNSLSFKDMNDVTSEVLEDTWNHFQWRSTTAGRSDMSDSGHVTEHSGTAFDPLVDCPRIELEALHPYFEEIRRGVGILRDGASSGAGNSGSCATSAETFSSPQAVWDWVQENVAVDDAANPQGLRIPPVFVWRERVADTRSRDIFYVAMCRSLGFSARLDEVTSKPQYLSGDGWIDVQTAAAAPQGRLILTRTADGVTDPEYYTHFTLAKVSDGSAILLTFNEEGPLSYSYLFGQGIDLDEGYYMLTTGRRLADGSVLSRASFFNITEGSETIVPLTIRSSESSLSVLGGIDVEKTFSPAGATAGPSTGTETGNARADSETAEGTHSQVSILSATGRGYFILTVLAPAGDEPSNHARQQLTSAASDLNAWGRPVLLLSPAPDSAGRAAEGASGTEAFGWAVPLEHAVLGFDTDDSIATMLREGMKNPDARLPLVTVADSFGRIVYFSQGYNTSLAEDLRSVIAQL